MNALTTHTTQPLKLPFGTSLNVLMEFFHDMSFLLEDKEYSEPVFGVSQALIDPNNANHYIHWLWNLAAARRLFTRNLRRFHAEQDALVERMTDEYYSTDLPFD